jgi:hypothetical protein
MQCIKCGDKADPTVYKITGKEKCVECCIKGYKFVISQMHREKEKLEKELAKLKK